MKPSIGRTVYCLYESDIYKEEVGYLGRDSFIVDDFSDLRRFDSLEWFYEEYQRTWFTSLARAKKFALAKAHRECPNYKFDIIAHDDYYTIRGRRV